MFECFVNFAHLADFRGVIIIFYIYSLLYNSVLIYDPLEFLQCFKVKTVQKCKMSTKKSQLKNQHTLSLPSLVCNNHKPQGVLFELDL